MGSRGPAPTPTAERIRRGETRPSRLNHQEPVLPHDVPKMPRDLSDEAKAEWRRVMRSMRNTGVIRGAHAAVLRLYCEAYVAYVVEQRQLALEGSVIPSRRYSRSARNDDDAGEAVALVEMVKNPRHQVVRDNRDAAIRLLRELCLTPPSLAGMHVAPEHANDSLTADIGLPPRLQVVSRAG